MTFANNLDPDEAPQNVGPHLRSKLFDTQIVSAKCWMKTVKFLQIFKEFFLDIKHLLSMQRVMLGSHLLRRSYGCRRK